MLVILKIAGFSTLADRPGHETVDCRSAGGKWQAPIFRVKDSTGNAVALKDCNGKVCAMYVSKDEQTGRLVLRIKLITDPQPENRKIRPVTLLLTSGKSTGYGAFRAAQPEYERVIANASWSSATGNHWEDFWVLKGWEAVRVAYRSNLGNSAVLMAAKENPSPAIPIPEYKWQHPEDESDKLVID